eukprot:5215821-Amphidinium_carterae.1
MLSEPAISAIICTQEQISEQSPPRALEGCSAHWLRVCTTHMFYIRNPQLARTQCCFIMCSVDLVST